MPPVNAVAGRTIDLKPITADASPFDLQLTLTTAGGQLLSTYRRRVRVPPPALLKPKSLRAYRHGLLPPEEVLPRRLGVPLRREAHARPPRAEEPQEDLGMVFETVGKLDEAATWYEKATKAAPDRVELAGNLARVLVRLNRPEDRQKTRKLLHQIVAQDQRPDWVSWARKRLALMPKDPQQPEEPKGPKEPGEPKKPKEPHPTTKSTGGKDE